MVTLAPFDETDSGRRSDCEMELRQLRQFDSKSYETLVEELRQMGHSFFERIVPTFKNSVKRYISDVLAFNSVTEGDACYRTLSQYGSSSSLSWNSIISTSFTIVPTQIEAADARDRTSRSFDDIFENLVVPGPSSQTCLSPNGLVFSYISSLVNNRMSDRFAVEEPYSDY